MRVLVENTFGVGNLQGLHQIDRPPPRLFFG